MNKILLVAKREFLSRVQKKTFLLTTILLPLLIFVFYALIIYFSINSSDNLHIAVVDQANILNSKTNTKEDIEFIVIKNTPVFDLDKALEQKKYDGYIENILYLDYFISRNLFFFF